MMYTLRNYKRVFHMIIAKNNLTNKANTIKIVAIVTKNHLTSQFESISKIHNTITYLDFKRVVYIVTAFFTKI